MVPELWNCFYEEEEALSQQRLLPQAPKHEISANMEDSTTLLRIDFNVCMILLFE
jgi:hypothetical protein